MLGLSVLLFVHHVSSVESMRKVEQARASAAKAKEVLAEAVACQEKKEALLADGEEKLSLLRVANETCSFTFCRSTNASRPRHHGRDATDARAS